jgi:hypothetical protein
MIIDDLDVICINVKPPETDANASEPLFVLRFPVGNLG